MQHVTLLPLDLCYTNVIFELSSDPHIKKCIGDNGRKHRRHENISSFRNRRRASKEILIENDCE